MKYLQGTHIAPSATKDHIGKRVQFLLDGDIDKTGRGYFFPRIGEITEVFNRQINFGNGNYIPFNQVKEIVLLETEESK